MKAKITIDKKKIQDMIELLEFALSLDDPEILKSTIESTIESLKEMQQ